MAENKIYDLIPEMIQILAAEFEPGKVVDRFAAEIEGADAGKREDVASRVFGEYGARWAVRTLELGEKYTERTYEIIKEAAKKTGRLAFPHIPQRFIEIGYLATQPVEILKIVQNNHYALIFGIDRCATHEALVEKCGEAVAGEMPCRHACSAFCGKIFKSLNMDVDYEVESMMVPGGECRFRVTNKKP
ncbi:MAG: hypothetical protein ACOY31_00525 [Bacillota bacterium]